ncbi:MAG: hypothetical protein ACI4L9_04090, partial [Candidatus Coproplasma sp.]
MKIYDFDGMFEEKLADYIKKNPRNYNEKEWENVIPKLYAAFGDTVIKSIGKSPNEFFAGQSDEELVKSLCAHIKQGVPVSEFLCNAIESRKNDALLLPLLDGNEDEVTYALNLLGASPVAVNKYMQLLVSSENEDIRNTCVDYVKEFADQVKEEALANYAAGVRREYMLEILSRCVIKDEQIYDILIKEFRSDPENLPMHASYLAAYGDERALPCLMDKIDEEGITYVEFQELKFAIEALGGTYEKERDFSSDPYYQLIKQHGVKDYDIFKD